MRAAGGVRWAFSPPGSGGETGGQKERPDISFYNEPRSGVPGTRRVGDRAVLADPSGRSGAHGRRRADGRGEGPAQIVEAGPGLRPEHGPFDGAGGGGAVAAHHPSLDHQPQRAGSL